MFDEEPPVPEEVLISAKDQLNEEEISLADNEEILHALSELTPVYENDRSYFVLGNYDREPIRRLNLVVDRLNRRQNAYAFRMVDIRGEWDNSIQKFCLIADIVTYLVGVAEKEPSDFLEHRTPRWNDGVLREEPSSSESTRTKNTLRLDAGRRPRTVRPGRTAVSLGDRRATR